MNCNTTEKETIDGETPGREMAEGEGTVHTAVRYSRDGETISGYWKGVFKQHRVFFPVEYEWVWGKSKMKIVAVALTDNHHSKQYFEALYKNDDTYYTLKRYSDNSTKGEEFDGDLAEFKNNKENVLWTID